MDIPRKGIARRRLLKGILLLAESINAQLEVQNVRVNQSRAFYELKKSQLGHLKVCV